MVASFPRFDLAERSFTFPAFLARNCEISSQERAASLTAGDRLPVLPQTLSDFLFELIDVLMELAGM
jgi:hypothetical protein